MTRGTSIKILLVSISVAICGVLVYVWTYTYTQKKIGNTIELRNTLAVQERDLTQLRQVTVLKSGTGDEVKKISEYIVGESRADIILFVSYVEGVASKLGLDFKTESFDVQPNQIIGGQDKESLKIVMSAQGTYPSLVKFMKALETLPYNVQFSKTEFLYTASAVSGQSQDEIIQISEKSEKAKWRLQTEFSVLKFKGQE